MAWVRGKGGDMGLGEARKGVEEVVERLRRRGVGG